MKRHITAHSTESAICTPSDQRLSPDHLLQTQVVRRAHEGEREQVDDDVHVVFAAQRGRLRRLFE